jgi:acyl-coenzyme A thioesterase PaaI-like protein
MNAKGNENIKTPMRELPEHGYCFVCGSENEKGLGVRWFANDDGHIFTDVILTQSEQGPPGHAHGGVIAAILDEIMGTAAWNSGHMVLAANLNVDFRLPVPLNIPLQVQGLVTGHEGRKVFTRSELLLPDGQIAAVGKGIFVKSDHLFTKPGKTDFIKWLPGE